MSKCLIVLLVGFLSLAASTAVQAHSSGYEGFYFGGATIGYSHGGLHGAISVWNPGPYYAPSHYRRSYYSHPHRSSHHYCRKHDRYHGHRHGHYHGKGRGWSHDHGGHHDRWYDH